jgi:hypothetical protein
VFQDVPHGQTNPLWDLSPLRRLDSPTAVAWGQILWAAAAAGLLLGLATRICAVAAWVLTMTAMNLNPGLHNAGDVVRVTLLFYLMLCPCGAVWSLDAWWQRRADPVYVYPWPLRLLFVQMMFIYGINGLYKVFADEWRDGTALYYVMTSLERSRWSFAMTPLPMFLIRMMTWSVLVWELGFPLWVAWSRTRKLALWIGVAFHVGLGIAMDVGMFAPYMLCMYLPLVPWERWVDRGMTSQPSSGP